MDLALVDIHTIHEKKFTYSGFSCLVFSNSFNLLFDSKLVANFIYFYNCSKSVLNLQMGHFLLSVDVSYNWLFDLNNLAIIKQIHKTHLSVEIEPMHISLRCCMEIEYWGIRQRKVRVLNAHMRRNFDFDVKIVVCFAQLTPSISRNASNTANIERFSSTLAAKLDGSNVDIVRFALSLSPLFDSTNNLQIAGSFKKTQHLSLCFPHKKIDA